MNKIISIAAAIMMLVQLPLCVNAEEVPPESSSAEILASVGILNGDEAGNLDVDGKLTRAQLSALAVRIAHIDTGSSVQIYDDVSASHWANKEITAMHNAGILEGVGNGIFAPEAFVTLEQGVKIMVELAGIGHNLKYPEGYMMKAAEAGLLKDINITPSAELTRGYASKLILNTLSAENKGLIRKELSSKIKYVSADGNEYGDGSYANPWNSIEAALENASGHMVVALKDGSYTIDKELEIAGGESAECPLTIIADGNASVNFTENGKLIIPEGNSFVSVKGINFINETEDCIVISCMADNFEFKGNTAEGVGCVVEVVGGENALVADNTFNNGSALAFNEASSSAIINNTFNEALNKVIGIEGKSKEIRVSANTISVNDDCTEILFVLSDSYGISVSGNVIINNKAKAECVSLNMDNIQGAVISNNIFSGVNGAVSFDGGRDITLKNNIYQSCGNRTYIFNGETEKFVSDNNCYYDTVPDVMEANSLFTKPLFVSSGTDWRLMSRSPLIGRGSSVPETVTTDVGVLNIFAEDVLGVACGDKCNIGLYSYVTSGASGADGEIIEEDNSLIDFDFVSFPDDLTVIGGEWVADGGLLKQNSNEQTKTMIYYSDGLEWTDYVFSADVESPTNQDGNASGLIFRSDESMQNMYAFRFLNQETVEFCKWTVGKFASIEKWDYVFEFDEIYNLKVEAKGNVFTFYVNDVKVGEVKDNSYPAGTVGLYCYRDPNAYDNMRVEEVE